ncbi:MAG: hypothetical protein OXT06_30290 [Rhodospirillaceae bacterium]|nr:hypothetical protein [Rhodospirillaceae bacterium]MDD9918578.1 hypothetical protein [Rhodospirillaceae bacterium]MDD9925945.1 hypothetical protein [Rhodospirillaceae bacterium]
MSDATAGEYQQKNPTLIQRWLIIASTAVLCAALLAPFGALPPFDTGYYGLVSASIQWIHVCAGLGAALLAIGILFAPQLSLPAALNPASTAIAAFAILTAIPLIYADHAGLVLLGSPQSGKGVIWFLDAAIYIALAWVIRDCRPALALVFLTALLTTAAIMGLRLYINYSETELLLPGGDSYAYLGLLLPFLTRFVGPGPLHRYAVVAAWVVSAGSIAVSGNRAAIAVFVVFATAYGLTRWKPAVSAWLRHIGFWTALVPIAAGILAIAYLVVSVDSRGTFDSIDSRILIAEIGIAAQLEAAPMQWAIGHGWGHTQGAFYRSLTDSSVNLLDNRWDFLWRDIFHSHNIALELIYETGLFGFATFAALLAALIAYSALADRTAATFFAAGYVLMNSVWFEFAHTVPMLAMAVFALLPANSMTVSKWRVQRGLGLAMVATIAFGCLAASAALNRFDGQVKPFTMEEDILVRPDFPTERFPNDPRGDDFIRAAVYRQVTRSIETVAQSNAGSITPAEAVTEILDDIATRLDTTMDPELILVGLVIFNDAYFRQDRPWMKPIVAGRDALWHRLATRHLTLAPKRTDVLVVYLSWLVTQKRFRDAGTLITTMLRTDPSDPVGLYFKGVVETNDPSPATKKTGLQNIARAVDEGVERFLEIPQWLKKLAADAMIE